MASSSTRNTSSVEHQTSQRGWYRTGDMFLGCKVVLENVGRYRQVSAAYLIHTVFGPAPSVSDVSRMRKTLEDAQVLKNGRWAGFPNTPSESSLSESDAFQPLFTIISHIFNQVNDCRFSVTANPPETTRLSERKSTSRPDACIYIDKWLAEEEKRPFDLNEIHWFDIAIPFEFKKANSEIAEFHDEEQMVWSLQNVMREDPRRRFALGITIEDTQMRLWCHSRALLAVSVPIDFLTSIDDIISLFYLIGTRADIQLGWDPTVKRVCENGKFRYEFKIDDELFTTTRALDTFGADTLVGSGTRVYEAKDKDGNIVAIKDCWRDETRDPEGLILENILKDIKNELGEKEAVEAKKYFVAIRAYSDVVISGEVDKTFDLGKKDVHVKCSYQRQPEPPEGQDEASVGRIPYPKLQVTLSDIQRKVHARTVFKEVGRPLMKITRLSDCLACLLDGRKALYYLHKTGWVHCDFGVTNVLWFAKDHRGKLTDLEFAKKVDSKGSRDVRTGTMHFMAVEVEGQDYLFGPQQNPSDITVPFHMNSQLVASPSEAPFHMNFVHDLESEWWAAIWVLFYHTAESSPCSKPDEQLKWFYKAFPGAICQTSRLAFFTDHQLRQNAVKVLSDAYRQACAGIIDLARNLHGCYLVMESPYPKIKHDDLLEAIHKNVSDAHSHAIEELSRSNIQLLPVKQLLTKKRP